MHIIELLYCIGALCGPTSHIAGVTIDLSTDQVIRPIDYIRRRTRRHVRRVPPPATAQFTAVHRRSTQCSESSRDVHDFDMTLRPPGTLQSRPHDMLAGHADAPQSVRAPRGLSETAELVSLV